MTELAERLWAWLHTHEGRKIFRYSMVSVISTGVSTLTLLLVYGVLKLWSEVPSAVFANVVATFPSYWLNRRWAWGKSGRSHLTKEILPFWAMSLAGIAFSIIFAWLAKEVGGPKYLNLDHLEQTVLLAAANIFAFGLFWVLKLLLFNRLFKVHTLLEEIDEHLDLEEEAGQAAHSSLV